MAYADTLFDDYYLKYASYFIKDRAIPEIDDGFKPVQRRILHTLFEMDDGKYHKVANVVGQTMRYHPHGDQSIFGSLVNLANKDLFIEKQGNFGSILTGDPASAARYIECRLTTIFALVPDKASESWIQLAKIFLMAFVAMSVIRTEKRLNTLIWVTVASIAFYSVKGGIFTLQTGGEYIVYGPPKTFIHDNNHLAMAVLMTMPLMRYLALQATDRRVRWGLNAVLLISLVAIFGSYSRGAFLGLLAVAIVGWWRSNRRLAFGAVAVIGIVAAAPFIPAKWVERMDTIRNYEEDRSAMTRIEMWIFALNVAKDRPVIGGGFEVFQDPALYEKYNPTAGVRNVHSVYFEVLGTQGFVGFIIFIMLGVAGLRTCSWIKRQTKDNPALINEYRLANLVWISLIAYAASGAFINLSEFDVYYNLLVIVAVCKAIVTDKLRLAAATDPTSAAMTSPVAAGSSGFARTGGPVTSFRRTS